MTLNYQERRIYNWHEELDRRIERAGIEIRRVAAGAADARAILRELTARMDTGSPGIRRIGAYVPRLRLERAAIAAATAFATGSRGGAARGTRSCCNWDEDSLTMAVEAARDCLAGSDGGAVTALVLRVDDASVR